VEALNQLGLDGAVATEHVLAAANQHVALTHQEQASLVEVDALFPVASIPERVFIPSLAGDVHGVPELLRIGTYLCARTG
jgi:hypothetical protein